MVCTTPEAEAICLKNGLSFVDLLRPFAFVDDVNFAEATELTDLMGRKAIEILDEVTGN